MDLYKEILAHALAQEGITVSIPSLDMNAAQIVEGKCYRALQQIKSIIADEALDDEMCFEKIEEIVRVFEQLGSTGDGRHDFG